MAIRVPCILSQIVLPKSIPQIPPSAHLLEESGRLRPVDIFLSLLVLSWEVRMSTIIEKQASSSNRRVGHRNDWVMISLENCAEIRAQHRRNGLIN